jgi:hypothetical protein
MTPTNVLKAGAALVMRTLADNAVGVARYQATAERLKAKEAVTKGGASAQEGVGIGNAAQETRQVKAALGATRFDGSRSGGQEPGSTMGTPETVEAGKAKTSTQDAGQADVKKTKEVVETP